jgi:hypothetical protein
VPADGVKKSQLQIGFTYYRYKAMNNSTLYCTVPPCNFTTNEGPQLLKHLNSVHPVPNIYTRFAIILNVIFHITGMLHLKTI